MSNEEAKKIAQKPLDLGKMLGEINPPELRKLIKDTYMGIEHKVIEAEEQAMAALPKTVLKPDRTAISNMIRLQAFKNVVNKVMTMIAENQEEKK